jgi:hypothetical protein
MAGVASTAANAYWEIVPGKNVCFTCQTMRGKRFAYKPGPVHPNCTCEIRRVAPPERQRQPGVVDFGSLQGDGDRYFGSFLAGQKITITFLNLGPFPAGVGMRVDQTVERLTGQLRPGFPETFEFSKFGDTPMTWELFLIYLGLDGSTIVFEIRG